MIHLLSPAKSLDFTTKIGIEESTIPMYLEEASKLVNKLRKTSKKKVREMMTISEAIAELNVQRYQDWNGEEQLGELSRQALFAFKGDVYLGLDAISLGKESVEFAQRHLLILSGMYGALRPLDVIEPYRLEMGTSLKVGRSNNLYQFWKDKPTDIVNERLKEEGSDLLINLSSNEYFKVINQKKIQARIISPEFKDAKNGQYKIISFFAKKARGLMSRFLIEHKIERLEDIQAFDTAGYRYNAALSSENKPVFTREENQA
ncbi:MAG: hypothetical protein CMO34_06755 [Verrucomicrobia bacterium]|nr:hypothetical protein [Verrucomicrobiota bacterium]|tara:strand:+ start:463 stop:1245 length:783 start_codon:yes stop_codon:yes gene_type:complete